MKTRRSTGGSARCIPTARPLVVGAVVQDVAAQPRVRRAVDHLPHVALGLVADDAGHQAGGWCSPNCEPWSSLQNLKRPNCPHRVLALVAAHVRKDLTPELDDARDRRVHVLDGEEEYGPPPASLGCIPPSRFGVRSIQPLPDGPVSNPQPNRPS